MRSKNPGVRLRDILDNIDFNHEFTAGLDLGQFASDRKTVYAVVRALEIISEATRRLPDALKDRHSEIDWGRSPLPVISIATSTKVWTRS